MMYGYLERLAARGLEPNPYAGAFFQQVCISDTDASCEREWWPHVDYFFNKCLHLYPGTSPVDLTNRSTYLFATEVMPHLRPIWSEYEDHWSPKSLPPEQRAVPGAHTEAARRAAERPAAA